MYLIDRDRLVKLVGSLALFGLLDLFRQAADHGGSFRAHLRLESIRVGLDAQITVGVDHLEFVDLPILHAGDKQLPDAGLFAQAHGMTTAIPVVKFAYYRDALGIRCPDGEFGTGHAVHGIGVRTQGLIRPQVCAL